MNLSEMVRTRNLKALEVFCMQRNYAEVIRIACSESIDLDELDELLHEIS